MNAILKILPVAILLSVQVFASDSTRVKHKESQGGKWWHHPAQRIQSRSSG